MRSTPSTSRRWENSPSTKPGAIHIVAALRELMTAEFDRLHSTARHERRATSRSATNSWANGRSCSQPTTRERSRWTCSAKSKNASPDAWPCLEAQIEAGDIEHEQAQAHIDDCLALAGNCHVIYMTIDDSLRRIANQAFFDRLIVLPEDGVIGEPRGTVQRVVQPRSPDPRRPLQGADGGIWTSNRRCRRFEQRPSGGPRGARTHDPRIKSPMLYRLS